MIPNHYQTLEIEISATKDEIKKAYRRLALKFHPDKNKNPESHNIFIKINEAYLILYDSEARKKYDIEYHFYFGKKNQFEKSSYDYTSKEKESNFADEDLNKWTQNARKQAENFAKMTFDDFSNLILGIIKETSFQLGNSFLIMIGVILTISGCGNIIIGLFSKGEIGNPILGLIILPIGIYMYSLARKNYDKHNL